jgi:two-component system response regulator HydG
MENILIVDSDKSISNILKTYLIKNNFSVSTVDTGDEAISKIKGEQVDLVICDFDLPNYTGIELLQKIKIINSSIQTIIVTNYSSIKVAVDAVKKGAYDYVTKPLYPDEILSTIKQAIQEKNENIARDTQPKKRKAPKKEDLIVGPSYQSQMVQKHIALIAPTDMSVIITGETGTGKEYVAKAIHEKSTRREEQFIAVDCGAIPNELAGSELFGHVKGAFTGAISDKKGCFERADDGTLFLDEIGNLNYENQVQLLRVLQEKVVRPVGGTKEIPVNVRILTATNEDLKEAVKNGDFREDIYHRLNEFRIELVPLRERPKDIEVFAHYFLKLANKQLNKQKSGFEEDAMRKMLAYHWHGNLRELRNVVKRSVLICQQEYIDVSSLPVEISQLPENPEINQSILLKSEIPISLKKIAENAERGAIIEILQQTEYNKTKTAVLLQIDRKTLYNKMKAYNIEINQ